MPRGVNKEAAKPTVFKLKLKLMPRGRKVSFQIAKDTLSLVGCDFKYQDRRPLQSELDAAYNYAIREHLAASDNPVKRVKMPDCVERVSTWFQ